MKIFISAASENKKKAKLIEELIIEISEENKSVPIETIGWWDDGAFPFGVSIYDGLISKTQECDAAIIIAGEEDLTNKKNEIEFQPRDNVIMELGLFAGKNGKEATLLVTIGNPGLPSNLNGINRLTIKDHEEETQFKKLNRSKINSWIRQLIDSQTNSNSIEIEFPRLYKTIVDVVSKVKSLKEPFNAQSVDLLASNIFGQLTSSVDRRNDMATILVDKITENLENSKSIFATDVLGPTAWVTPNAFRYLAIQIKQYIKRNTTDNNLILIVDDKIGQAIKRACNKAAELTGIHESLSLFDDPKDFHWEIGKSKLQFARILLWSKEELLNPIAESVIAIHQAFNIPLFYLDINEDDKRRDCDFIFFEGAQKENYGFYNAKVFNFTPKSLIRDIIPNVGNCKEIFYHLLENDELLLAVDARHIYLHKTSVN